MMFFDDGSAGASSKGETMKVANTLQDTLKKAGWMVNEEKSCWEPSQTPVILGFTLDLVQGKVFVTERRQKKFMECLKNLRAKSRVSAKELAKLTGYIISMSFAVGPVARLRTRGLYGMILGRLGWYSRMEWSDVARSEIEFWWSCFKEFHGTVMVKAASTVAVVSTWSDASDVAWGGFTVSCGEVVARGNWPEEVREGNKSSTWRELRATELVLESLREKLAGRECRHRTDNQAAVRIMQVGSRIPELHEIAVRIFSFCRQQQIKLIPEWVPREENERADYFSKLVDGDDWQLSTEVFRGLDEAWGPHSIDCFASESTKKLEKYCSRWWNPGCWAVDAFTVSWEGENAWLCPPFYLIGDVLEKCKAEQMHGTLVIPEWRSAWWWPLMFGLGGGKATPGKGTDVPPKERGTLYQWDLPVELVRGRAATL